MAVVVDIGRREWYVDGDSALANGVPCANLMQIEIERPAHDALIFLVCDTDGEQCALSDPAAVYLWGEDRAGVEVMTFAPAPLRPMPVRPTSRSFVSH